MKTIYQRQIPQGDALREGRAPSHDGEYVTLYWCIETKEWLVENNAGVELTDESRNDLETDMYASNVDENDAWELLDTIDKCVDSTEKHGDKVDDLDDAMGSDAYNLARLMGWTEETQDE